VVGKTIFSETREKRKEERGRERERERERERGREGGWEGAEGKSQEQGGGKKENVDTEGRKREDKYKVPPRGNTPPGREIVHVTIEREAS
jgi:hypothetical protein